MFDYSSVYENATVKEYYMNKNVKIHGHATVERCSLCKNADIYGYAKCIDKAWIDITVVTTNIKKCMFKEIPNNIIQFYRKNINLKEELIKNTSTNSKKDYLLEILLVNQ